MSIIIASLDYKNKEVHIASDRRQTTMSGDIVPGQVEKLYQIKPTLYYCINGHFGNGMLLRDILMQNRHASVEAIIDIVSNFKCKTGIVENKKQGECVFMLAGLNDNQETFIYARYTETDSNYLISSNPNAVMRAIAAPNVKTAESANKTFNQCLKSGKSHKEAIEITIIHASEIDQTISKEYNYTSVKEPELYSNILATGTLIVGDALGNPNAGITGIVDGMEGSSVRFWAGIDYAHRETAPFRVQNDGKFFASNAEISGKVMADSGSIGNWEINSNGIINDNGDAYIIARESLPNNKEVAAYIGANVLPATTGIKAPALFRNTEQDSFSDNRAAVFEASGGAHNYAIDILSGGIRTGGSNGRNDYFEIKVEVGSHPSLGSGIRWLGFEIKNGLITSITSRVP